MEEKQEYQVQGSDPSYWTSVGIAGFLFGIILFGLSLLSSYMIINSEPTGSYFSPSSSLWCLSCLVGAFGGMLATWHYAREYDTVISLGRGALIGFLTGVLLIVISTILGQAWQFVDPDMNEKMIDSLIANFEEMDLPDDQKEQMIDSTVGSMSEGQGFLSQLLWNIPGFAILNILTGMLGAKIFGKKEEVIL